MRRTRVLLVDDHSLFREGLASLISAEKDLEVVGQAGDGVEAAVKAGELAPDLILMDVGMPGCDGLEATRKIKLECPSVMIVMLTVRDEEDKLFEAIKHGAQGYLLKSIGAREMLEAIRAAIRGEVVITPPLAGRMIEEFRRLRRMPGEPPTDDDADLTPRELQVLGLAAEGRTDKEIADALNLSLHTVKTHMRNVLAKLHVGGRREAAKAARHRGLV